MSEQHHFSPKFSAPHQLASTMHDKGYAVISTNDFHEISGSTKEDWQSLIKSWHNLSPDLYLKDGGKYRKRRHASVCITSESVQIKPHRAHWQPTSYNALHGGIDRWFEPCEDTFIQSTAVHSLLKKLACVFSDLKGLPENTTWYVETHQFRIDTSNGIGRPTPEGAHRDGVDFVAVILIERHRIKGGETRVFKNDSTEGQRFTLSDSLSMLLMDDAQVMHETTPIRPLDENNPLDSWRDTLVLTYRLNGFQAPSK